MVSCGMNIIKYLLFVFNLLFAISGIAILAIGATILVSHQNIQLVVDNFSSAAVLLIAIGSIVFLVSFLGCCGAIRNSNVMVMSFAVLLIIIFILELTAAITGYVLKDTIQNVVEKSLTDSISSYYNDTQIQEAWNIMQHDFKCCGVNGPADWEKVSGNKTLPAVCCPDMDVNKETCMINGPSSKPYQSGCMLTFEHFFTEKAVWAGSIGLGICFIQLVGVILACCLARAIRKDYETV